MKDNGAYSGADRQLLAYVQQQTKTGTKVIRTPASLLEGTTDSGLSEARTLAKLCGCSFSVDVQMGES